MRLVLSLGILLVSSFVPSDARACMWERDTLLIEHRGLPGVLEAIVGLVPRHDPAVYEARIAELEPLVEPTPAQLDDLAVALERLGEHARAEAVLRRSLQQAPERYETLANLGTVLVHDGRLEEGLALLSRAVEINPDAHFGREWVQIELVELLLEERRGAPRAAPLLSGAPEQGEARPGEAAREGLVGIVAMGGEPHPAVFWALEHSLEASFDSVLALYARQRVEELDPGWYDDHVRGQGMWMGDEPDVTEDFQRMRREADAWMARWHAWQRAELQAGRDPTTEAAWGAYLEAHPQPELSQSPIARIQTWVAAAGMAGIAVVVLLPLAALIGLGIVSVGLFAGSRALRRA